MQGGDFLKKERASSAHGLGTSGYLVGTILAMFLGVMFAHPQVVAEERHGASDDSRTAILWGQVRSKGNRIPIPDATVIGSSGESVQCNAEGRFSLRIPADQPTKIKVEAPGFKPGGYEETVKAGDRLEVVYSLEPVHLNPYETIVYGERERTEVSRVRLRAQELREVPGTMGDPFRVVMLLPGVGSMASGVAYPVVRGAAPASTGYLLGGVRVPVLFHLFLGPAVVHPDFIDAIDFFPGAPPVQYGRLLGGVVEGKLSKPRDDRLHGSFYADLINAGGFVEYPIETTKTNFSFAGRYSYTPWLLALTANAGRDANSTEPRYVFNFWDYQGRVEQQLAGGRLQLFAFGSNDQLGTQSINEQVPAAMQSVLFHRIDLRYQHAFAGGQIALGGTWGIDSIGYKSQDLGQSKTDFFLEEKSWAGRASWTAELTKSWKLTIGGDLDHRQSRANVDMQGSKRANRPVDIDQPVAIGTFGGGWVSLDLQKGGWTVVSGVRVDDFHLVPKVNYLTVDPRITIRRKLGDAVVLKTGAGLYHQAPSSIIQVPVVDIAALKYGVQKAVQLDLGAEWKVFRGLEINIDFYYNPLIRTLEINPFDSSSRANMSTRPFDRNHLPDARQVFTTDDVASRGMAYGMELMVRHPLGGSWFGWIAYSLQRSSRYTQYTVYDAQGNAQTKSGYLPYAFDQTHILNAVLSYKLPANWTIGAVFHFNTGRPESGIMTSTTQRATSVSSRDSWTPVSRDRVDRLPCFFRVDLRVSKSWAFDTFALEAYLDVLNASFQSETLAYTYAGGIYRGGGPLTKTAEGFPVVLPILGVKATY